MKTRLTIVLVLITCAAVMSVSCLPNAKVKKIGFLSDYSRLEPDDGSLRYINMQRLGEYSKFIIEPVYVRKYLKGESLSLENRMKISDYMQNAIIQALQDQYAIVSKPGSGVVRVKIAITDIDYSVPALNALPQTKIFGLGIGGASMEGELLDSETGEQIAALVESQKGKRLSLAGLEKWGDAKAVMDEWAERFRQRLDEAHGK
jgi:hypothetical protein